MRGAFSSCGRDALYTRPGDDPHPLSLKRMEAHRGPASDTPPPIVISLAGGERSTDSPSDGVDLAELANVLPPVRPPWPRISALVSSENGAASSPCSMTPPLAPSILSTLSSFTSVGSPQSVINEQTTSPPPLSDERRRIQFADHVTDGSPTTTTDGAPSSSTNNATSAGGGGACATGGKRPPSARRKKSIRIILDEDKEKDEVGLGAVLADTTRNIRFREASDQTPASTPLDSKGSGASHDHGALFEDKLRLLSVSDACTGSCLFKLAWNWRAHTNVDGVGSLVQSFYQFAREVGHGGLSCISFELPARRSHHRHTPRKRLQMQRSQASMSLLTCRDSVCVVSLFVDDRQLRLTDPEVEAQLRGYMEAVRARFAETYAAKVESLRPTLKAMADGKNQTMQVSDIQVMFQEFEQVVVDLREQMVPST